MIDANARDRLYTRCAQAVSDAGDARESLFLARLVLLLFEQARSEEECARAIDAALDGLPYPSMSARTPETTP